MPKSKSRGACTTSKGKKKKVPGNGNPWVYKEKLKPFLEAGKLSRSVVLQIECRDRCKIRTSLHVTDEQTANDEMFRMFGEMLGQDAPIMRQWVQCFVLTHKKFVRKLAGEYLKDWNLKITEWLKSIKASSKADILVLFILCTTTDTHCFMHTKVGY